MIKARPKYPTDLYDNIYIDNIQKAVVICLIIPTTFPFDAGSSVTSEKCIIFEDPASKGNVVGMIRQMTADKVYQLLSHGRWFSPGTPASSTTKTGRHDIAEILLKVALNAINLNLNLVARSLQKSNSNVFIKPIFTFFA